MREHLGLSLFNFDVLLPMAGGTGMGLGGGGPGAAAAAVEHQQQEEWLLYVIDINYFPGYEKLPGYEELMVGFLQSILPAGGSGGGGGSSGNREVAGLSTGVRKAAL